MDLFFKGLTKNFDSYFLGASDSLGEFVFFFKPEIIFEVLLFLKGNDSFSFEVLIDLTAVDYPYRDNRFSIVYNLLSLKFNKRVRIIVDIAEDDLVSSVFGVYSCANWYEREVFDMFGIVFKDSCDLRRILTDYDFDGFPLRKDFPLTGNVEVRYDSEQMKVVYDKVKLSQAYRDFNFLSPWSSGSFGVLPGDEKSF